jgi:hypothetical protein
MYFPVRGIAIAKNARKTENGSRISFAVTDCPSVVKYAVRGATNTLHE